jgi:ribulose-5-phosphate 4-epimerase/fuculose-1-phosphate aldolase
MDQSPSNSLSARRLLVANGCRILGARGLAEDVLGHISVRTGPDRILIRCRGPREEGLFLTQPADIREVDLEGAPVDGGDLEGWSVPNELPIHAEVLRARPDVDAVVHCHPPSVLMAGLEGVPLRPVFGAYHIPAARMALEGVPVYPRSVLVRRPELGREVAAALGDKAVLVMRGHGITAVGSGEHAVEQAVVRALALDVLARVSVESARLGGRAQELSPDDVAELPDLGGSFNDVMMFRHHLARLRHEGLLLQG